MHRLFLDSNVLVSRTFRDWIFLLRNQGHVYQLHSTNDVIAEAIRAVRRMHPRADGGMITGLKNRIEKNLDEVLSDFPGDISFDGKDLDDLHVHAAATFCDADILVTDNTRDFGDPSQCRYDIYTADEVLCLIADSNPRGFTEVARDQAKYWSGRRDSGDNVKALDKALVDAGCPEFATVVKQELIRQAGVDAVMALVSQGASELK